MASWQSILAVVGGGLFVWWFLNKGGCQGDGNLTGEGTALCYTGPTIEEMIAGVTGGEVAATQEEIEEEAEKQSTDTPDDDNDNPEQDPRGSPAERARMQATQLKRVGKTGIGPTGVSTGITPAAKKANWAHSYMIQNSITLA